MINPVSISEQLMYATLRVESKNSVGTAFAMFTPGNTMVIISNRHFAEGNSTLDFTKSSLSSFVKTTIHLDDGSNVDIKGDVHWFLHPSEDLAFFVFGELLKQNLAQIGTHNVFIKTIPPSMIPSSAQLNSLNITEDITMVGYPDGQFDKANNYPLFRYGKTATHPAVDFNGQKRGMIDVPCIPGSSGSPVLILNESMYYEKTGTTHVCSRTYLLGIEVAMPQRINTAIHKANKDPFGNITSLSPTDLVVLQDYSMGYYIKASELDQFKSMYTQLGI